MQPTLSDVQTITAQAVTRSTQASTNSVIVIVNRDGGVLGVWSVYGIPAATTPAFTNFQVNMADAIAKARSASYFSSAQHTFTSRR